MTINIKTRWRTNRANWPWFYNANLILVTSSNWINCSFSRPSKVRMSFCQIAAKFFFFKFKICQTVARHKYDQSISQKIFCCLSLINYLVSKLQLPHIGVISAIVHYLRIDYRGCHGSIFNLTKNQWCIMIYHGFSFRVTW